MYLNTIYSAWYRIHIGREGSNSKELLPFVELMIWQLKFSFRSPLTAENISGCEEVSIITCYDWPEACFFYSTLQKKKKRQKENTSSRCLFSDNRIWNVVRENEERRKISSLQHMITVQWNKKKSVPRLLLCVRAKDSDTAVQRKRESTETCRCASVSLASDGNVGLKDLDSHENRGWTEFKQLEALESGVLGMTEKKTPEGERWRRRRGMEGEGLNI